MIITVTLNPAIDKIMEIPDFQQGGVCTVSHSKSYPAGKGINVARTLGCLGQKVLAFGCIGQQDRPFFDTLKNDLVQTRWYLSSAPTRTNLTIVGPTEKNGAETHIRERGKVVDGNGNFPLEELKSILPEMVGSDDLILLSGSLPSNAPAGALYELGKACREKGFLVLDSSGQQMKDALACHPRMIKPNLEELEEFAGKPLSSENDILEFCQLLCSRYHIEIIVVSLGKDGAILYYQPDRTPIGTICTPWACKAQIRIENSQINTVGSGDAMVAGLCYQLAIERKNAGSTGNNTPTVLDKEALSRILEQGVLMGTANLFNDLPGFVEPAVIQALKPRIQMTPLCVESTQTNY